MRDYYRETLDAVVYDARLKRDAALGKLLEDAAAGLWHMACALVTASTGSLHRWLGHHSVASGAHR